MIVNFSGGAPSLALPRKGSENKLLPPLRGEGWDGGETLGLQNINPNNQFGR